MNLLELIILTIGIHVVSGDYHIGFSINSYNNPSNELSDRTCCGTCMAGSCRTTLRLCFRDAKHSHSDVESDCVAVINRADTTFFSALATDEPSIQLYYPETFQLYARVSHSVQENTTLADFEPPFTDPHIDDIFIEADIEAITYDSLNIVTTTYTMAGEYGRATLSVSIHIRCAQNYYGSGCEMLCDSNGINCNTVLEPTTAITSNESAPTLSSNMTINPPPITTNEIDTTSTIQSTSIAATESTTNVTSRVLPRGRSTGFLVGIIVACVLIFLGIIVIILTVIAVAVCVYRKQRKNIHKLGVNALEVNEVYAESERNGTAEVIITDDDNPQSDTNSVQYEGMDALRDEIMLTEANNAYNITDNDIYAEPEINGPTEVNITDNDNTLRSDTQNESIDTLRDEIITEANSAYGRV